MSLTHTLTTESRLVCIILQRTDDSRVLIEENQYFCATKDSDSHITSRYCPVTVELEQGEDVNVAVSRALKEELGVTSSYTVVRVVPRTRVRDSVSYTFYDILVEIHTLPDGCEGNTVQYTKCFEDSKPRLITYWKWMNITYIKQREYKDYIDSLVSLGL